MVSASPKQTQVASFELEGLWPTDKQLLLLKAGLCAPDAARRSMLEWLDAHNTTHPLEAASLRLVPLVHSNLASTEVEHPLMNRFATVARLTSIKSQQIKLETLPVLEAFHTAGIPVLVLKGLHLSEVYYATPESRPMSDVDLAVEPRYAEAAHTLLTRLGYTRDYADKPLSTVRHIHHASSYACPGKVDIDLHWRIMPLKNTPATDAPFWRDALDWKLEGVPAKVLSPTHLLYHTVIHGVRWNPLPPLRWIGDAMVQLQKDKKQIDWEELKRLSKAHRTTHRLGRGLRYLSNEFSVDLPETAIVALEKQPISLVERIENRLVVYNDDDDETNIKSKYVRLFGEHCRACFGLSPIRFVTDYLDYLVLRTQDIQTRWALVSYLLTAPFQRNRNARKNAS